MLSVIACAPVQELPADYDAPERRIERMAKIKLCFDKGHRGAVAHRLRVFPFRPSHATAFHS